MPLKQGEVCKFGTAWFLATIDGRGVWLTGNAKSFKRTPKETQPDLRGADLWILSAGEPVPPEKWPPRVCAAVAKERLLHAY